MENENNQAAETAVLEKVEAVTQVDDPRPENSNVEGVEIKDIAELAVVIGKASEELVTPPKNTTDPLMWHGKGINGESYSGYGPRGGFCVQQATEMGSQTCHVSTNPDYIDPASIEPEPSPQTAPRTAPTAADIAQRHMSAAINEGYRAGYEEADAAYQDLKALILAWASLAIAEGRINGVSDEPAFLTYARNNH